MGNIKDKIKMTAQLFGNIARNSTLTVTDLNQMIPDYYSGINMDAKNDDLKG